MYGGLTTACLLVSRISLSSAYAHSSKSVFQSTQIRRYPASVLFSTAKISISDAYDGGNIEFLNRSEDDNAVSLRIKPDPYTELEEKSHFQYFSFRSTVSGVKKEGPVNVEYVVDNAGDASYAEAWDESTVFFSSSLNDPDSWRRKVDTQYKEGKLAWNHEHTGDGSVYFAYFPPFSYARHLDLIERSAKYSNVQSLGQTLDGREIECVRVGSGERSCWIIHRQHPGEHMAEFFAEGLLTRLLGLNSNGDVDGLVRRLLSMYTFYIVPSMCPDGAVRGHLRTNACGANLNREWASSGEYTAPSMERSPEVFSVLEKMKETGCDVFLDIHGDEELPYNFLAQAGVPNWGPRLEALHGTFLAAFSRTNPDMQQEFAYDPAGYSDGDVINIASDQVAFRFDCLSVTLEMPFKDCWSNRDPERGWSPARSRELGASVLQPLMYIHPYLREEGESWKKLPPEDAYVRPTSKYK
jgi:murein tripeptide amidase MpaA